MLKHLLHETYDLMKHKQYENFKTFFCIILIDFLCLLYDFIVNLDTGLVTDFPLAPCVIFILYLAFRCRYTAFYNNIKLVDFLV